MSKARESERESDGREWGTGKKGCCCECVSCLRASLASSGESRRWERRLRTYAGHRVTAHDAQAAACVRKGERGERERTIRVRRVSFIRREWDRNSAGARAAAENAIVKMPLQQQLSSGRTGSWESRQKRPTSVRESDSLTGLLSVSSLLSLSFLRSLCCCSAMHVCRSLALLASLALYKLRQEQQACRHGTEQSRAVLSNRGQGNSLCLASDLQASLPLSLSLRSHTHTLALASRATTANETRLLSLSSLVPFLCELRRILNQICFLFPRRLTAALTQRTSREKREGKRRRRRSCCRAATDTAPV